MLVDATNGRSAEFPYVVMDGSGNAMAVWRMVKSVLTGQNGAYASQFTVSQNGWSPSARLDNFDETITVTHLAGNSTGQAITIWDRILGTGARYLYASHYAPSSDSWGSPVRLDRGTTDESDSARIGMDQAGNAQVVWRQREGNSNAILSSRYAAATGMWETPLTLGKTGPGDVWPEGSVHSPWVALNPAGGGMAAWSKVGSPYRVFARAFGAGTWGDPQGMETTGGNDYFPNLAMDAAGNVVAVWTRQDATGFNTWASWYR